MEVSYNSRKYIEYRFEGFWDSSNPPHFMHNYKIPSSVLYQSLQFFIHSSKRFQKFGFELLLNLNRSIWFYCKCVVKWRWSRGFHGKLWTHTHQTLLLHTLTITSSWDGILMFFPFGRVDSGSNPDCIYRALHSSRCQTL
jgi:hypothetical protein